LRAAPLALVAACALIAAPAGAQEEPERMAMAQGLYDAAVALIGTGRWAEACPKLEESLRLDPALGTRFQLASCWENVGRPTSAWSLFLEVADGARAAGNPVRESTARARAAALEPRLPRISVVVDANVATIPGLAVTRDDLPLKPVAWGTAVPVDLGQHVVRAEAPGKAPWSTTVRIGTLGQRVEVMVPVLADAPSPAGAPPHTGTPSPAGTLSPANAQATGNPLAPRTTEVAPAPTTQVAPAPLSGQHIAAIVVGSVGAAGLVTGGTLGLLARSAWRDADAACPSHRGCSPDAHDRSVRALSLATGSTAAFVAGSVAGISAIVLGLTAPKGVHVAPLAGAGAVGLTAGGVF
jgi:hypothetical protein